MSIKSWKGALFALGLGFGVLAALPSNVRAEEQKLVQTVENRLHPDSTALPRRAEYGYVSDDANAVVARLLSYETDAERKEMRRQFYLNSVWYRQDAQYVDENGKPYLLVYEGTASDRRKLSYELLAGLPFFSNAKVLITTKGDKLIAAVELGRPFTEAEAYRNYRNLLRLQGLTEEVKAQTAGKTPREKAQFICDTVAKRLNYDYSLQQNCLQDVVVSQRTACVGYNGLTELLFRSVGLSYVNMIANNRETGVMHIFGTSKIDGNWLIFDTSNYDNESGPLDASYIFSELEHEAQGYRDFKLLQGERLN